MSWFMRWHTPLFASEAVNKLLVVQSLLSLLHRHVPLAPQYLPRPESHISQVAESFSPRQLLFIQKADVDGT